MTEKIDQFKIECDKESIDQGDFLQNGPMVRAQINVKVDGAYITSHDGEYRLSDYLPYNCTKMARAAKNLIRGQSHMVKFTDTVCDIHFNLSREDTVFVYATGSNGKPRNQAIPEKGLPVSRDVIVAESIRYGDSVREMYNPYHERFRDSKHYKDFIKELSSLIEITEYD